MMDHTLYNFEDRKGNRIGVTAADIEYMQTSANPDRLWPQDRAALDAKREMQKRLPR